jgi:alpha-L-fucosidase
MDTKVKNYLAKIDEVIQKGSYKDNWESLRDYPVPKWYENAKFGIFIHWGVYSVPAFGNEWYPRNMYIQGTKEYEHHIKTYGPHKNFGYADFIPMFKAEYFNADAWMKLIKASGARYVMPVAEHHDGFQMYGSELSDWNSVKMGPKRDVLGELKASAEKEDIVFCASNHRAENYWFYGGGRYFDSGIQNIDFQEPYGYAKREYYNESVVDTLSQDIYSLPASTEHLENWLARNCELIDKYRPKLVWFDWWIQNVSFKPYLKKFAAYYYNRAEEWGEEVAINYKFNAYAYSTAILDIERGQLSNIQPRFWQTDTAVAKNSWCFTENNDFKNPVDIICDLIDIVSKNGCMLLNIGPKSDGTITKEDEEILRSIGKWLSTNGESIYNTTYWESYGEGPTEVKEGAFTDTSRSEYTSKDIRFTYKAPYLYANILKWPSNGEVNIKSLGQRKFKGAIKKLVVLGYDVPVSFTVNEEELIVKVNLEINSEYPVCLKIEIE